MLAIKQTIYRTGSESPLMDLLIEAARRGKEVMVVVELKARFDEEANINWAERLEAVGAQVVYGIVGLKTHAKLLLVTRREGAAMRRYVHLSTGNYNPKTARLYTDVGYLTADAELTADADAVFQQLASLARRAPPRRAAAGAVHAAPADDAQLIERVADAARAGRAGAHRRQGQRADRPGADRGAGAMRGRPARAIDLIVRGACMLPPGVPGVQRQHPRALGGRALPRAHARALLPLGRGRGRRGAVPDQRRLDEPQHVPPHRDRLAGARRRRCASVSSTNAWCPTCTTSAMPGRLLADGRYRARRPATGVSAQQALMQRYGSAERRWT